MNQWDRNRLHRANTPAQVSKAARLPPNHAPSTLSNQSTLEGTRMGKKNCRDSMPQDKAAAIKVARVNAGRCGRVRRKAKVKKKPKGA